MTAKKKKAQGNAAPMSKEAATSGSLPFEPVRQKPPKPTAAPPAKPAPTKQQTSDTRSRQGMPSASSIPEIVNRRMVSRAAFFCGVPTACAILTFVGSYLAIANDLFKPPTAAVLLVSLGFFGLGVLGLSYGPLSASWDEERLGNALGFDEFKLNFGRLRDSWRAAKAKDASSD